MPRKGEVITKNQFLTLSIMMMIAIVMGQEWNFVTHDRSKSYFWKFLGMFYITLSIAPLWLIKGYNSHLLMWLFTIIWSTDTFAYIFGKVLGLGKHKINKISPKKSYEGLFFGIIFSLLLGSIFSYVFLRNIFHILLFITPLMCILEQVSDFFESYIKRHFNIKDTGSILPGHGGVLDRMDGFLLTTWFLLLVIKISF